MRGTIGLIALMMSPFVLMASAQSVGQPPRPSLVGSMGLGLHSTLYSPVVVLRDPRVREELKLTDNQLKQLKSVEEKNQRANLKNFEEIQDRKKELGDMPDPQALADYRKYAKVYRKAFQKHEESFYIELLDKRQRTRLLQVQYQAEGPMAFTRPEVQERLNFSPAQIEQILAIVEQGDLAMEQASRVPPETPFEPLRGNAIERRAQLVSKKYMTVVNQVEGEATKVRASIMRSIAKILTKGQRANYEKMIGEIFDFRRVSSAPIVAPSSSNQGKDALPQQK